MLRRFVSSACALALLLACAGTVSAATAEQAAMARRVAAALKESGQLTGYKVGVKYQDGVAWLVGTVSSPEQLETAVAIAEQVEGIEQVVCKLEVAGQQPAADTAVQPATGNESTPSMLDSAALEAPAPEAMPQQIAPVRRMARSNMPRPMSPQQAASVRLASAQQPVQQAGCLGGGCPPSGSYRGGGGGAMGMGGGLGANYDNAHLPNYAWPSYAAYPNYAAVSYPTQYSPTAWPYIGPFYPYPQVPLGWRKVTLEWDDGWWMLDFSHCKTH